MIDDEALVRGQYAARVQVPEVYRRRRRRVQAGLDGCAVALLVGGTDERGYGDVGSFRQEPMFYYLTGVEIPGSVLLLERERDTLFLPTRRPNLEAWTGPKIGAGEEAAGLLGFDRVIERDGSETVVDARRRAVPGWGEQLAGLVAASGQLWVPLPPPSAAGALRPEQEVVLRLRERLPTFRVGDLTPLLVEMRLHKEAGEIELIRGAVSATVEAMIAAGHEVLHGVREGAVEGAAFAALRRYGAESWSFPPIVGSGRAGCILHYDANLGTLAEGETVVVDIGARFGYYCADLTRTFPVGGSFSLRQRRLYEAVMAAYDAAVAELHPGTTIADVRQAAFAALESSEPLGDDGRSLGQFFIHGIGHFLGIEAHDVGGEGPTLAAGMVVTIEPGVYLPGEGVGIRIEDDYLITEGGAENLSAVLPRDPEAVERMARPVK
jgi:Xaa-Pro aminopeptidase